MDAQTIIERLENIDPADTPHMAKELATEAACAIATAEWVGYYFGLQRALNKGPHTRIAEELEAEMGDVLLKMPPGTVEAWPSIVLTDETDS